MIVCWSPQNSNTPNFVSADARPKTVATAATNANVFMVALWKVTAPLRRSAPRFYTSAGVNPLYMFGRQVEYRVTRVVAE